MNMMMFGEYCAVISYDHEIEMFRGEFVGLSGGADFYADSVQGLKKEGAISLQVFLEMCEKSGVAPKREYSGEFVVCIAPKLHETIALQAAVQHKSLNQWVNDALKAQVERLEF